MMQFFYLMLICWAFRRAFRCSLNSNLEFFQLFVFPSFAFSTRSVAIVLETDFIRAVACKRMLYREFCDRKNEHTMNCPFNTYISNATVRHDIIKRISHSTFVRTVIAFVTLFFSQQSRE